MRVVTKKRMALSIMDNDPQTRSAYLAWAEEHAIKNLEGRIETAAALESRSDSLLTVLIAAIGASLVFGVGVFEPGPAKPVVIASAFLCGYLWMVTLLFAVKVLWPRDIPAVHSEPEQLLEHLDKAELDGVREGLLDDLQDRIKKATRRNEETARWIRGVLVALLLAPILFSLVAIYFKH